MSLYLSIESKQVKMTLLININESEHGSRRMTKVKISHSN